MLVWGLVIAIILFPLFFKVSGWFGKRKKITSLILTLILLSLVILPSIWLVNQMIDGIRFLADNFREGQVSFPVPPESVQEWPLLGNWLYDRWLNLSQNFAESLKGFMPQITSWIEKLIGALD